MPTAMPKFGIQLNDWQNGYLKWLNFDLASLGTILRGCLVREIKFFRCHIGCFGDVGRGFRILIKKTNYIARLETVRRIY